MFLLGATLQIECQLNATYLVDNGGNVGGGATIELGISLPVIPMPCSCSGRSDVEALNPTPRPAIMCNLFYLLLLFLQ